MTHELKTDWFYERAACKGHTDPDADFYAERGDSRPVVAAKGICAGCSVRQTCLELALARNEKFGVWGGKTERERRKMRRAWALENPHRVRVHSSGSVLVHGTRWAYAQGCRCDPCREANAESKRRYREKAS